MSLRTQIHEAIDDVAPPAPALERRVKASLAGATERGQTPGLIWNLGWAGRFRGAAAMVAVLLVLVLATGLFVGGRLWRNVNAPPSSVSQAELKNLEARPLAFPPTLPAGAACPATPLALTQFGMTVGAGPVYMIDNSPLDESPSGRWYYEGIFYNPPADGLVLIRAKDLQTGEMVVFGQFVLTPSAITPVGPLQGQDVVAWHKVTARSEAAFHDPRHTPPLNKSGALPPLILMYRVDAWSSDCVAFQFDGPGFTENLVAQPTYLTNG